MEGYNIEIFITGINANLTFNRRTAELFPHQMSAMLERYPDNFTEYSALFRPPTLAYCGYYVHCQETDMPVILSFDDFCEWSKDALETEEGRLLMNNISELYSKHAEV
jgi:hypothetical protein